MADEVAAFLVAPPPVRDDKIKIFVEHVELLGVINNFVIKKLLGLNFYFVLDKLLEDVPAHEVLGQLLELVEPAPPQILQHGHHLFGTILIFILEEFFYELNFTPDLI